MASLAAVRFVPGAKKSATLGYLQIQLRVKAGAGKYREGIGAVNDNTVELCVAAQPRDGEANKAVISVLSSVLGVPKSRLILSHGLKSRDKIAVMNDIEGNGQEYAARVLAMLREESTGGGP
jgi:uncharacterized protein